MSSPQIQAPRPSTSLRERKKQGTRARILRAATTLFAQRGFDATTVDELAEAAEVSRATFFNYFEEKSGVVSALCDAMTNSLVADVTAVLALDLRTSERLEWLFLASATRLNARPGLTRSLVFETIARRRERTDRNSRTTRVHASIAEILARGIERDEVRTDVPLSVLAELVVGGYVEVLLAWMMDESYPLEERIRQAVRVFSSAIAPIPA